MPINIYEIEGRASAVLGGTLLGKAVYEGAISFIQSMTSVDQTLSRSHGNVACVFGFLFITSVGAILHANSHSINRIDHQNREDYPNVNA